MAKNWEEMRPPMKTMVVESAASEFEMWNSIWRVRNVELVADSGATKAPIRKHHAAKAQRRLQRRIINIW